MYNGMIRKRIAALAIAAITMTLSTGYSYYQGLGEVVHQTGTYLTEEVYFSEKIAIDANQAVQHAYTAEILETDGSVVPYVFVGDVSGRCTMDYLMELVRAEGYSVVAGINGDFFDTATGVPLGMSIHEGKIINSGANYSNAIGFRRDGTAFAAPIRFEYSFKVNGDLIYNFNHVNKPRGVSNGLHFYNSDYGKSTKTTTSCTEVILAASAGTALSLDTPIQAVVEEVRPDTSNTPIGAGKIVLSAAMETSQAAILATLVPGDSIEFSVSDLTGVWGDTVEAIGAYQIIAQYGAVITTDRVAHPRTCLGIKKDGSVILYAVDGRQSGHSVGMNLTDVASYLIERGCDTVVNLDGGGSTTFAARMPGDSKASVLNKPSDGKQRSISNGLLFVQKDEGNGDLENLHLYPMATIMLPGASVRFEAKATDDLYYPVDTPDDLTFESMNGLGDIDRRGIYTAGREEGEDEIRVEAGRLRAESTVKITTSVNIYPDRTDLVIDPGKSADIGVKAYSRYVPVICSDELFTWTCDERIGTIDRFGVFKATDRTGVTGKIYVSYNGKEKSIPVQVGPATVSFTDSNGHWAQQYIEILAAKQVVNGMGDGLFLPDAPLTRAQFLTMLSKTIFDLDLSTAPNAGFTDVTAIDWYTPYVNWGYANGIVSGNPDGTFAPDATITREQMAVILNNFAKARALQFKQLNGDVAFSDSGMISPWAMEAVGSIVRSGIMNGRPEGNYDPQGFATRAEASKVIYSVLNQMD